MKRITITDIAREAGVSKSTVSRVLNNAEIVDAHTCNRVQSVIDKYQYVPSSVARNLSNRHSDALGVVIPEIANPLFGRFLQAVSSVTDAKGLPLYCFVTDNSGLKDLQALELLYSNQVKGIIYIPANRFVDKDIYSKTENFLRQGKIPTVLVDRRLDIYQQDGVFFDNVGASYTATRILLAAGHSKIAIINGSDQLRVARERRQGYLSAMEEAGIAVDSTYMPQGDFTTESGYERAKALLSMPDRPTAVLTCNDYVGLGFYRALAERGESVPNDIELIGFDRIDALTCLGQCYSHIARPTGQMVAKAMDLLFARIEDPKRPTEATLISPRFVLSKSLEKIAADHYLLSPETFAFEDE